MGFIGPNGAGKSTTIKMLSGILSKTSGSIRLLNMDPFDRRKEVVGDLGIMFGHRTNLWLDLPVIDSFDLTKAIYEIDEDIYLQQMDFLDSFLQISKHYGQTGRTLSLGQRVKCDFALALVHDPKIIILDEPTIGLDIMVKREVKKLLQVLHRERKKTIIYASHDLNDIEELSDRILVIDRGEIIYQGEKAPLLDEYNRVRSLSFQVDPNFEFENMDLNRLIGDGKDHKGEVNLSFEDHEDLSKVIKYLLDENFTNFTLRDPRLEEIIYKMYDRRS